MSVGDGIQIAVAYTYLAFLLLLVLWFYCGGREYLELRDIAVKRLKCTARFRARDDEIE